MSRHTIFNILLKRFEPEGGWMIGQQNLVHCSDDVGQEQDIDFLYESLHGNQKMQTQSKALAAYDAIAFCSYIKFVFVFHGYTLFFYRGK